MMSRMQSATNAAPVAEPTATLDLAQLRAAFAGPLAPVKVGLLYRVGLLLVAVATVILPLVYLGLIAGVAYAVYLHAVNDAGILDATTGRRAVGSLIIYLAPIAMGATVVLFMLKPFFAPREARHERRELTPEEGPLLWAFVTELCRTIGAPVPRRIDLDMEVNASAGFRRGFASFFGRDLVLTIGLPLLGGLPLRQLAGILAHELGHFAQGSGMRLTYTIRTVNLWFAQVVYQRDRWDEALTRASKEWDFRIGIILYATRGMVWLTRKILWALMMAGHAIGMLMLRQMEHDADQYEIRLVGSATFEATARRLRLLGYASMLAHRSLFTSWKDRQLCDDLPGLIATMADAVPAAEWAEIEAKSQADKKAALFDTHPPDAERIERARREQATGIFTLEAPASDLLPWSDLVRRATLAYYREDHELEVPQTGLLSLESFRVRHQSLEGALEAADAEFHGLSGLWRPIELATEIPQAAPEAHLAALRDARAAIATLVPATEEARKEIDKVEELIFDARRAGKLIAVDVNVNPAQFGLTESSIGATQTAEANAIARHQRADARVEPLRAAIQDRLLSAFALLDTPLVTGKVAEAAALREEVVSLLGTMAALRVEGPALFAVSIDKSAGGDLMAAIDPQQPDEDLYRKALPLFGAVHQQLGPVIERLQQVPYPFPHAQGKLSIGDYLLTGLPPFQNFPEAIDARADSVFERLGLLHGRTLGRLASIARQVEAAVGI